MTHFLRGPVLACGFALLTACAVGPNYKRPVFDTTAAFKEEDGWKPSEPADTLSRGAWWQVFKDDALDQLEQQVDISNENVKAAAAAFEESMALVRQAEAGFWPSITASGSRTRSVNANLPPYTSNRAALDATWNLDIWGQIRRSTESNRASAQASAAALAAARLSAQATLAIDYFELRYQDQLQILLANIVDDQQKSLKITESRYRVGVAAKADVVTAQTQLLSSQAQQVNAGIQRGVLEHAVAVLIGQQPAAFSLKTAPLPADIPTVPPGLPSALLERRPDVAEAERRMAAANAQIGVAVSAFFPSVTISASDTYTGNSIGKLIRTSNRVWAFGPTLAESLFDGGLRRAQVAQARAAYDFSVDSYRQTVLAGFEQVEDELVTLRVLEKQAVIEDELVKASREAETLTLNQYKAGTVPYSSVISAQTTRLNSEETALAVLLNRFTASVTMIEALGGGWNSSQLQ